MIFIFLRKNCFINKNTINVIERVLEDSIRKGQKDKVQSFPSAEAFSRGILSTTYNM